MSMDSLKDIYIDQLQDIHSANKQSAKITKKLAEAATSSDLKKALQSGVEGIEEGMKVMAELAKSHDVDPGGEHCKGMEGLVKEAQSHALDEDFGDDDVRDAMIITQYQRMVHYGIAGYGCLSAFAKRLDLKDDAKKIDTCLDHPYEGDRHMTDLAIGPDGVNADAAS